MRRRIRAMAEGKFDYKEIEVKVSEERIERMAQKNDILKGSVILESSDERKLKGLIYTTDRRMVCEDVQFRGRKVRVTYEFDTTGMEEGDTNKGEIYIESNAGEIIIPYVVSVSYEAIDSSIGKIRDLFHFANLAQMNYQEAYRLFCSKKFKGIRMDEEQRSIYEALAQNSVCKESMEEFLIAINKKQPVRFLLDADQEICPCEGDSFKKEVLLTKTTWGYFTIRITTDVGFITMDKAVITSDDFVGNHCRWEFIVDKKKLHAGRNVARIIFTSAIQTETISIEIGVEASKDRRRMQEKHLISELGQLYIQVRNHTIKEAFWLKEAVAKTESLSGLFPEKPLYMLMQAHMYMMSDRQTEGKWILNKFEDLSELKEDSRGLYAYYMYIDAMQRRNEEYNRLVCRELQEMMEKEPQDFSLLFIRLFMDEEPENNKLTNYRLLKEQFAYGCRSPFLYLEACLLLQKDVSLFNRLDAFEKHLLLFAVKHQMLDKEMARRTAELSARLPQFEPFVYHALTYACDKLCQEEGHKGDKSLYGICVEAVCSMLIRANKRNRMYFPWFEKGVRLELKLTQLFEYYMYTIPMDREEMLPKTLLMYFNFDNHLDYRRKAYLFVNVWKYREELGELFYSYEPGMKLFVLEQVTHRHMDERLACLYKKMADYIIMDAQAAAAFEELIYTWRLTCKADNVRNVIVRHEELDKEEVFPITDKTAYIRLYHPSAMVLLEDKEGRRHLNTIPYEKTAFMTDGEISGYCNKLSQQRTGLLLNRYYKRTAMLNQKTAGVCEKLLEKPKLRQEFRQKLRIQLIEYYMDVKEFEQAQQHLPKLNYEEMSVRQRAYFIELMIIRSMYEQAYELIDRFGPEQINPKRLVRMCSRLVTIDDVKEPLLELCQYVFLKGKYDEMILEYLTRYFYGPTWQMDRLWRAAKRFDVETYGIGERILIQMLFTGYLLPDSGEVFEDYYKPGYKTEIVQAYLAFFAYYYVVHEQIIDERILQWIEKAYVGGEVLNQDCKAALLKYYAGMPAVPEDKIELLQKLMGEFVEKELMFPFFVEMDSRVSGMFRMSEKTLLEHRASPDKKVFLFYGRMDMREGKEVYVKEAMEHVYDSIFVKEMTVFCGEIIQYYIMECDKEEKSYEITASGLLENAMNGNDETEGRYRMLNEMATGYKLQDEDFLHEMMQKYSRLEQCSEELFAIIE